MDNRFVDEDLDWLVEETIEEKEWDESKHPREPAGSPTGGQFGSGGGGGGEAEGSAKETAAPKADGKVKVEKISDFTKDDVGIYDEVRNDPDRQKAFFDTWNRRIGKAPGEFKKEFLGNGAVNGTMTLNFMRHGGAIEVRTFLRDKGGIAAGQIVSTIYPGQDRVHMDYYVLSRNLQGHGIMKQVMAQQMKIWQDIGIKKVDLLANIDVGGHAWARYGFTPVDNAWYSLSASIERDINHMGSGGESEGYEASSWEELDEMQADRIEQSFYRQTRDEFVESEETNWRDSGQALEQVKKEIADNFDQMWSDWGKHAVEGYKTKREENGKPQIPFTTNQILNAISVEYSSRHDDGQGDFEVTFDDAALGAPMAHDPAQETLPGIPKLEPHEYLTEDMRADITNALEKAFDTEADKRADDVNPPTWIANNAQDFQREYWEGLSEREKFKWAERNAPDLLGGTIESEGTGDIPEADAERLRKLTDDGPKAVWAIADSKYGKDLLMNKNWDGKLKLDDKQAMDRFYSYVGKAKKE